MQSFQLCYSDFAKVSDMGTDQSVRHTFLDSFTVSDTRHSHFSEMKSPSDTGLKASKSQKELIGSRKLIRIRIYETQS